MSMYTAHLWSLHHLEGEGQNILAQNGSTILILNFSLLNMQPSTDHLSKLDLLPRGFQL